MQSHGLILPLENLKAMSKKGFMEELGLDKDFLEGKILHYVLKPYYKNLDFRYSLTGIKEQILSSLFGRDQS